MDALLNRLFLEPALGLGYPLHDLPVLRRLENYMTHLMKMNLSLTSISLECRTIPREIVKYSFWVPFLRANLFQASKREVPTSAMGWEIYPESIYHMLKQFSKYDIPSIIITENGLALNDKLSDESVGDPLRIKYLKQVLKYVHQAQSEGVKIHGYFYWTFLDNFEWAEGYYPRFGLVYNHHKKQRRVIKDSGYWWQQFLQDQE